MSAWISPKEGASRFRKLETEMQRQHVNALRRGQHRIRARAFERFASTGVGRAVFGNEALQKKFKGKRLGTTKQARVIIKRDRVTRSGTAWTAPMTLRGFASLVEIGGRTKPHTIPKGAMGKRAVVPIGHGGFVTIGGRGGFRLQHPGSQIPRQPFFEPAARAAEPEIRAEVQKAHAAAIALSGLAG